MKKYSGFRGKVKGYFYRFKLDRFIPVNGFIFLGHIAKVSQWIRKYNHIEFSDFYSSKFDYKKRYKLFEHVINKQKLNSEIDYLEFGVAQGNSFKWWVSNITNEKARFFGFDTFTGLPEDWGNFKKGDFANNNEAPKIDDNRHQFFQGLFQQTLFDFLKNYKPNKRIVLHLDADLYTATLYVLTALTPFLKKGDILFFDEFNVPMHEFKAFIEWTNSYYIKYEVLGSVNNFYQVAIMIN